MPVPLTTQLTYLEQLDDRAYDFDQQLRTVRKDVNNAELTLALEKFLEVQQHIGMAKRQLSNTLAFAHSP